ncbi:hypothetical protein CLOBY_22820 [Clostridium saccharobutylicum]|uniref:hypothetical protein n=1 Tax=Clostridium saccharobutylicum TaxID=169679 RepID=UPI000983A59D|nr:hypothetical protein [Clostridium saccharobutylicum]AQS10139.1 hypothetical protein CLOBY_22820 [Clostridium saccharobutylicum]MBC2438218.1 hypothetical protein [Clostridium saccharobutylicum]NSB90707.1 hypothetical protein [Clostridium saccharobutylicum]NYC31059.1 hypothetical protein [Clostridium saccharobutylicum]OOM18963.1 hypothetical protein CLSAB_02150 [Clostridium saccharobutylicum]
MSWFYDKEISLCSYSSYEDEHGIKRNGWILQENDISCDVQPYSLEKCEKDYGYSVECTKRVFMDCDSNIVESSIIQYQDKFYEVKKIPWCEDYMELLLLERKDVVINA